MWKDVTLMAIGVASTLVLAFFSHESKSKLAKVSFWISLMATLGLLVYSGIDSIDKSRELAAVEAQLFESKVRIQDLSKSLQESRQIDHNLQEQLEIAKSLADTAHLEARNARNLAHTASEQAAELRAKTIERSISGGQAQRFRSFLERRQKGSVTISINFGDQEALAFASQVKALLKDVGWNVKGVSHTLHTRQPTGLLLVVHSRDTAPASAGTLQKAFAEVGYEAVGTVNPGIPETTMELIVGKKQ